MPCDGRPPPEKRRVIWKSFGMDATRNVGDLRDDSVRLSSAQKRDLLGMSAAAVITAALMVAPAILPRDQDPTPLASRSVPSITTAPVLVATRFEPPVVVTTMPARHILMTRRTATGSAAWAPRPATTTATVVAVTARMDTPRKPLARRLAGFLTGDGTHAIRPFPTIPTERQ
jgi:hypothetical protein